MEENLGELSISIPSIQADSSRQRQTRPDSARLPPVLVVSFPTWKVKRGRTAEKKQGGAGRQKVENYVSDFKLVAELPSGLRLVTCRPLAIDLHLQAGSFMFICPARKGRTRQKEVGLASLPECSPSIASGSAF